MPGVWFDSGCGSGPRVRFIEDGRIEVEGMGTPTGTLDPRVNDWADIIWKYSNQFNLWAHLVAGVVSFESRGVIDALSPSHACGLMQLLPSTASHVLGYPVTCDQLRSDADLNIRAGTAYLNYLTDRYNQNPIKIAAAYNAGSARCGCPCKTRSVPGDPTSPCAECLCLPNQWNLVTDCAMSGVAVDYPMTVFRLANAAWQGVFNPANNPGVQPSPPSAWNQPYRIPQPVSAGARGDSGAILPILGLGLIGIVIAAGAKAR
jgi:hypothetical protein